MIDDTNNAMQFSEEAEIEYPPPAHFDESATANAQPVQPIPAAGIALWLERARHVRRAISGRTRIVVLAIIGGLAIGALGGAMLLRPSASRADSEPVVDGAPIVLGGATASPKPKDETAAPNVAATELPTATQSMPRFKNHHTHAIRRRAQQAYRVAVIR